MKKLSEPSDSPREADTAPEPKPGGYRVQLPEFEGPLDFLLHLIKKHELDILDIPIGFVTEKYFEYIKLMEELSIDVASEYLVVAAQLAHIKSKMLLPTPPEEEEDAEPEEDPRLELVRRLLEYQKYKSVAEDLADRWLLGRDVFGRGAPAPTVEGPAPLAPVSLFKLLDAFQAVLRRTEAQVDHEVDFERISITDRIHQLSDVLETRRSVTFEELFEKDRTRADVIITFMALLEMARLRMLRLNQDDSYGTIHIEVAPGDSTDANATENAAEPPPAGEATPAEEP